MYHGNAYAVTEFDFVDQTRNRSPRDYPYAFDAYYVWRYGTKGSQVIWADRMFQQDRELAKRAFGQNLNSSSDHISKYVVEEILKTYFGRNLECVAYGLSCNVSNGYPIGMFFVKEKKEV